MKVELSKITADIAAQPRTVVDVDKVAEYAAEMARGDKFPPLIVFHDGRTHWLADGFHRFYAAQTAKLTAFNCDVREGALRDAVLFSCGANASHGLRRTNHDKRRAVAKLLDDPEWAKWSNYEIAKRCAVDEAFVRKVRGEHDKFTTDIRSETEPAQRTYITKHGTESTMNVANIGRVKEPAQLPPLEPQVIADRLRAIKNALAVLPEAAQAAQQLPDDQRYFYPISDLRDMAAWFSAFADAMEERITGHIHEQRA